MIKIAYPAHPYKIKTENGKELIFDTIRKQWVALTPEEWVRQNFLQYLLQVKKYPGALIAVEKEIRLGELVKRCDIVIYDNTATPLLMAECKAMDVNVNAAAAEQIIRYNISLPVRYLVITNGSYCFAFERTGKKFHLLREIPGWNP
ncbi:type I restriction enzyme HsdR N-terminal domain-containing protein [Agriterribacter sp.]|uniref:type I restriction enzyme HsdR N-terminal domain-containing protein n=1 Tax=Agriterribacter sp. TaxID=2821509 RepID=UPI002C23408A|nr:type I restriction enzyme HsdR N-terminal domain-containing protein [Agriterribacter sp.]HRO47741.1 type I restriction enzyme HsdR N-terminal domain-containing protein [Agriterribacter sp.]HRQ17196.1 type I restriction enzyme HsdR N-terminal domain-containing protein [Agriterribacter sp.]